ncbi:hypothetical protein BJX76DRAFT_369193 [Aspergillus varians]
MLRSKPTRVALTEDDLCYHIDSIFSRNNELTKWHRQRTGSGNSYDRDDDEDELFLDSDAFSLPETRLESECDETQSQSLADDTPQETPGERITSMSGSSCHVRPVSVHFISPEPSPSNSDSNSHAVVRSERALSNLQLYAIQSAPSAPRSLSLALQLALLSSTDWNRVSLGHAFTSQHNLPNPRSLVSPSSGLSQPTEVILDASLSRLLSSIIALPVRISGYESGVKHSENSRKPPPRLNRLALDASMNLDVKPSPMTKAFDRPSSRLPKSQPIPWESAPPPAEMKRTHYTESESTGDGTHEPESSEVHTPEPCTPKHKAKKRLTEIARNSGSAALQLTSPEDSEYHSTKKHLNTSTEPVSIDSRIFQQSSSPDEYTKDVKHFTYYDTVSRGTQTDLDMAFLERDVGDKPADSIFDNLGRQENIVPSETAEQPSSQQQWQDPFITAMFQEPNAPVYDPTSHIRRGIQGYVNPPTSRGRTARNQHRVLANSLIGLFIQHWWIPVSSKNTFID